MSHAFMHVSGGMVSIARYKFVMCSLEIKGNDATFDFGDDFGNPSFTGITMHGDLVFCLHNWMIPISL